MIGTGEGVFLLKLNKNKIRSEGVKNTLMILLIELSSLAPGRTPKGL